MKIVQITAGPSGIYGLGDDSNVYKWHGGWRLVRAIWV